MIKEAIAKIVAKEDLTYDEAYTVMNEIMNGETIDEISGCAQAMREHAEPVPHPGMEVLEIVGTGGDKASSFNVSTTSAFVIAESGIKVAKHGNRAASSKSGTADCLEALGANISLTPDQCIKLLEELFCRN